ncbi:MAG: coenzyme F420 hydrogenase/dehydrogenase beta subunit N-terminal domain-containing protein [Bacteroidales bacterium]
MRSELCNRCGSCVGLSGGKATFRNREGRYLPVLTSEVNDELADRMWTACSGKYFSFPEYRDHFYKNAPHFHEYIGAYKNIMIGFANDEAVRRNSASGGIISAVLIWLLEKGRIDGVVTLRMSPEKPWLSQPFIATTSEQIMEAAQSKYTISSVNEILPEIEKFDGTLA